MHTGGGGVAILIKKTILHKTLNIPILNAIECIAIEIKIHNTPQIIISAYSPKYTQLFKNDIAKLMDWPAQCLVFGDFNAKHPAWNGVSSNRAGNALNSLQNDHPIQIFHPPSHTHHPHSGSSPSTIDLLITNSSIDITNIRTTDASDHCAIICDINISPKKHVKHKFNFKIANWSLYRVFVSRGLASFISPQNKS